MKKNVVKVKILGRSYPIKGNEPLDYLFMVGNFVDKMVTELSEAMPYLSTQDLAVLAALNMADELLKQTRIAGEWEDTKIHTQQKY